MYYYIYDRLNCKFYRPHGRYSSRWGDTPMLYSTLGFARNAMRNVNQRDRHVEIRSCDISNIEVVE